MENAETEKHIDDQNLDKIKTTTRELLEVKRIWSNAIDGKTDITCKFLPYCDFRKFFLGFDNAQEMTVEKCDEWEKYKRLMGMEAHCGRKTYVNANREIDPDGIVYGFFSTFV